MKTNRSDFLEEIFLAFPAFTLFDVNPDIAGDVPELNHECTPCNTSCRGSREAKP